jgi:hypothetical protein
LIVHGLLSRVRIDERGEEQVLVKTVSARLEQIPATYEWQEEQSLVEIRAEFKTVRTKL